MAKYENIVLVDVEAAGGISPASGRMTEFGAVHFLTRKTFHGILWDAVPLASNPAVSVIIGEPYDAWQVMADFAGWLEETVPTRPLFVSDNPAYDFQWINYEFDRQHGFNPFGHSGRRISDFYAGQQGNWSKTQQWKRFRRTKHDHNPVNDAMGNAEALATILGLDNT